ncbi:dnaJ homolog subfamily B member 12b [Gadus morhua]|uniref:DnaJ heat shock protein family (Hsp40) member B12b n=1 Tax=Gadus morhua TaxID=8049 RepID=A0A8C4YUJ6_GADMO|nr:dnaJ homolog subfamily B member 12 [Gadus morhua]
MEVNRDEADRCIEIATAALSNHETEKARRFLEKAQRLFPTNKGKMLLDMIAKNGFTPGHTGHQGSNGEARYRHQASGEEKKQPEAAKPYTSDQLEAVRRIKQCKDFYEILGVLKEAPQDELKRAYKKLALRFHPDKNHAPGATEAFKAIGNAYAVLSNVGKRRQYDQCEEERGDPTDPGPENGPFQADISPEDLFNMFFGGVYPSSNTPVYTNGRMRNQRPERRERQREGGLALFVQVMPILILVIVSALSQMMVTNPPYSLSFRPSSGHTHKRLTETLKVAYYVGDHFTRDNSLAKLKSVERAVEEDFVSNLRNNCWKEKQQKEGMLYRARYFGDNDLYQRAQKARTPSCAKLSEISPVING